MKLYRLLEYEGDREVILNGLSKRAVRGPLPYNGITEHVLGIYTPFRVRLRMAWKILRGEA